MESSEFTSLEETPWSCLHHVLAPSSMQGQKVATCKSRGALTRPHLPLL